MSSTLSNPHLHFTLDPATSSWSLYSQTSETPSIDGARFNGLFRFPDRNWPHLGGLQPWHWRGSLTDADISRRTQDSPHGPLNTLAARVVSGMDSMAITVEFALPQDRPFLLIRVWVHNAGAQPFKVVRLNPLFAGPLHKGGAVRLSTGSNPLTFFSNGWQSWSFAGALTARRTQPYTALGWLQGPPNHNPATPASEIRGQFSGDMFGVLADPTEHSAIVAGFLSQRQQFGSIDTVVKPLSPSLRLRAQCDNVTVPPGSDLFTDWAYVQLLPQYDLDPLAEYAEAVGRENAARVPARTPVGWCSWYYYFANVTEAHVRANLEQVAAGQDRLPLSLVQLDDGFETEVGDWFTPNAKFPSGLRALAQSIAARGLIPGLWLAPFIAKPGSRLAHDHPDWFIRNPLGLPANAGFVFNKFSRGLDVTHPDVQEHTRELIGAAVNDWGYPYLKLDFLYAAALPGARHDPTRTRAQALRLGLDLIREAAGPEAFLLGCGCPLGTAVGVVDAMRINADVDPGWRPSFSGLSFPFRNEQAMPSTRNAIRNSITRAPLHRRWWLNDPDCLLVRDDSRLSLDAVTALATVIALTGGMFFVSDDLTKLSAERRRLIEPLLPVLGRTALARDWLEKEMPEHFELPMRGAVGDWAVIGLFNWDEKPATRWLPHPAGEPASHVHDFWQQTHTLATAPVQYDLPPHSGRLLAVRSALAVPQYLGSSLHFSQGGEVEAWEPGDHAARLIINLGREARGHVVLSLPPVARRSPAVRVAPLVGGEAVSKFAIGDSLGLRVPVTIPRRAEITVQW